MEYRAKWLTRLHLHYYQGTFLSDRYFAETFVKNLSSAMNSIKSHVHAQIRRVPISMALPMMFQPENIVSFICTTVKLIGVDDLTPLTTPRDFADSHSRHRRSESSKSSSSKPSSTRNVRQVESSEEEVYCVDIRQTDAFWSLDEDLQLSIHSLVAATHNQSGCHGCGGEHPFAKCPKLKLLLETNKPAAKRMLDVLKKALGFSDPEGDSSSSTKTQRSLRTDPRSSARSSQRDRTPPTSNRRPVRQLQDGSDTDDDVTITQLDTDDEGTTTDDSRDFR